MAAIVSCALCSKVYPSADLERLKLARLIAHELKELIKEGEKNLRDRAKRMYESRGIIP